MLGDKEYENQKNSKLVLFWTLKSIMNVLTKSLKTYFFQNELFKVLQMAYIDLNVKKHNFWLKKICKTDFTLNINGKLFLGIIFSITNMGNFLWTDFELYINIGII